ncbi:hypothetical protein [Neisseria mucosa]|uniref:hypothetical protein n=1 Tax=Neisseria mucosa TaxID=488 RepID=UPI00280BA749|nr:hypothetical protein [Neisseria mucosa]
MKQAVLFATMAALAAAVLSGCGKSKEEIELEREKIALQREKLQQIRESKQVKPETAPQPERAEAQTKKDVQPEPARESVTVNVNQAEQQAEVRRVSKAVMISNAKTYFSESVLRSVEARYKDGESILCGEVLWDKANWRRFVQVNSYNDKDGKIMTQNYFDKDYSHEFSDTIWREYCR